MTRQVPNTKPDSLQRLAASNRTHFKEVARRANAYPALMKALRKAHQFLHDNAPDGDETLALVSSTLIGELDALEGLQ